jgi:hypothetical protein
MFEVGKFKEETICSRPADGEGSYVGRIGRLPNPKRSATPARFPTVIQIVPLAELVSQ